MLTQLQITATKPKPKPCTLSDGQGLALVVQPSGAKLWRFRYRYGGAARTLHIGPWPTISLADAREKCREARKAIAAGHDPVLEKKRAKIIAKYAVRRASRRSHWNGSPNASAKGGSPFTYRRRATARDSNGHSFVETDVCVVSGNVIPPGDIPANSRVQFSRLLPTIGWNVTPPPLFIPC